MPGTKGPGECLGFGTRENFTLRRSPSAARTRHAPRRRLPGREADGRPRRSGRCVRRRRRIVCGRLRAAGRRSSRAGRHPRRPGQRARERLTPSHETAQRERVARRGTPRGTRRPSDDKRPERPAWRWLARWPVTQSLSASRSRGRRPRRESVARRPPPFRTRGPGDDGRPRRVGRRGTGERLGQRTPRGTAGTLWFVPADDAEARFVGLSARSAARPRWARGEAGGAERKRARRDRRRRMPRRESVARRGSPEFVLTHEGFTDEADRVGTDKGWNGCFDALDRLLR